MAKVVFEGHPAAFGKNSSTRKEARRRLDGRIKHIPALYAHFNWDGESASHDCDAADNKNDDGQCPRVAMKSPVAGPRRRVPHRLFWEGSAMNSKSVYDWNMLPIGQQLWLKELQSYETYPPLQAAESYNLSQVIEQVKRAELNKPQD
jgi:hypothetical protein